jgi:hypothetical protein
MSVRLFGVSREGSPLEVGLPRRGNPERTLHREITEVAQGILRGGAVR